MKCTLHSVNYTEAGDNYLDPCPTSGVISSQRSELEDSCGPDELLSEGECFYRDERNLQFGDHTGCDYAEPKSAKQLDDIYSYLSGYSTDVYFFGLQNPSGSSVRYMSTGDEVRYNIFEFIKDGEPDRENELCIAGKMSIGTKFLHDRYCYLTQAAICRRTRTIENHDSGTKTRFINTLLPSGNCLAADWRNEGSYGYRHCDTLLLEVCEKLIADNFNMDDKRLILESDLVPATLRSADQYIPTRLAEKLYNKGAGFICQSSPDYIHNLYPSPTSEEWRTVYDGDVTTCLKMMDFTHPGKGFESKYDISRLNKNTFSIYVVGKYIQRHSFDRKVRVPDSMNPYINDTVFRGNFLGAGDFTVCKSTLGITENVPSIGSSTLEYDYYNCTCHSVKNCTHAFIAYYPHFSKTLKTELCEIIID